jgi:hypothetical protein
MRLYVDISIMTLVLLDCSIVVEIFLYLFSSKKSEDDILSTSRCFKFYNEEKVAFGLTNTSTDLLIKETLCSEINYLSNVNILCYCFYSILFSCADSVNFS